MNTTARAELEELLLDAQQRLASVAETVDHFHVITASIFPGERTEDSRPEHPFVRWLAVVQDSDDIGRGPAAFDGPNLHRLAARAAAVVVTSEDIDPIVYQLLGATAAFVGPVLLVKTTPPLYAAWKRFLSPHPVPVPVPLRAAVGG